MKKITLLLLAAALCLLVGCDKTNTPADTTASFTDAPIENATETPTESPTEASTEEPTEIPTEAPTEESTEAPTEEETVDLSLYSQGLIFISNEDGTCAVKGPGTCTDTVLLIPPLSPDGDTVTSVGDAAFRGCATVTSVVLPDTVTLIDRSAFFGCSGLTATRG